MIGALLGSIPGATKLAGTVGNIFNKGREIRKGNQENREVRRANAQANALAQFNGEFIKPENWFDSLINGANRTPRPVIANGTVGLFIYAFVDPKGFSETMTALDLVPPELWWLLSSIVVFYFGARELSHSRKHKVFVKQLENRPANTDVDNYDDAEAMDARVAGKQVHDLSRINDIMDREAKEK